jgi:lipooligosaccharide transport system permease protein
MATPSSVRAFEFWMYQYRRTWRGTVVSSFLNPVLYLAALGVGLGSLVDKSGHATSSLDGADYAVFLAPGLLAASAMQLAAGESTWPVLGSIKWTRTYHAMLATPLRIADVIAGHVAFVAMRLVLASTAFLAVMAVCGATQSWAAVLAVPAAVLTGLAFSTPLFALAGWIDNNASFNYVFRFGVIPMFLFSGTFFPITQLPQWMQWIAYVTPLWHGVNLCRDLALGTGTTLGMTGDTVYLLAVTLLGFAVARRTFTNRLVP